VRTFVVTGANRGIGLELCKQIAARGERPVAVCRKSSPELEELRVPVEVGIDVASDEAVRDLGRRLAGKRIDVLIHNAGIMERQGGEGFVVDSITHQFTVNALGPLKVTAALLRNIPQGGKIAIVTSRMGSIADNTSGGAYGYRMSKAAVNMAGKSLAVDLAKHGIAVALLHPGFVRTKLTGMAGDIDPPVAAAGMLQRIDELSLETTGGFWHANGARLPW
jgi:NAD(P)-dependent dehydrogenase (short-subunit alcohol dehydrogenase family)